MDIMKENENTTESELETPDPSAALPTLEIHDEGTETPTEANLPSEKDLAFLLKNNNWRELSFGGPDGGPCALQAFSPRRQAAAQSIGMKFLNFDQEQVEELQNSGTYNGIFPDAVLAIFLCTRPNSIALKALRAPSSVQQAAFDWMDQNEIVIGSDRHAELLEVFGDLANAIIGGAVEVDETGTGGSGDSLGESSAIGVTR